MKGVTVKVIWEKVGQQIIVSIIALFAVAVLTIFLGPPTPQNDPPAQVKPVTVTMPAFQPSTAETSDTPLTVTVIDIKSGKRHVYRPKP